MKVGGPQLRLTDYLPEIVDIHRACVYGKYGNALLHRRREFHNRAVGPPHEAQPERLLVQPRRPRYLTQIVDCRGLVIQVCACSVNIHRT